MTALSRANTLFVAEDWVRIYEALENVDFRAYDMENLVEAIMTYLRVNYPEEFNDWIASSEFVTKIEVLAWLSQNIAFRVDLNTRENFLLTAERRDSLLRLAHNVSYKVNRVRGARGEVKIIGIRTTQPIRDSNNINLQDRLIEWNDVDNEDWFEQFILVMNSAFSPRTKFGKPLVRYQNPPNRIDLYRLESIAPSNGTYSFNTSVNGVSLPFDIINATLDPKTGLFKELAPDGFNAFHLYYRQDGRGLASTNTGFFVPIRQGNLVFQDEEFNERIILRNVELNTQNINNDDFFVQEIDQNNNIITEWTKVDNIFGEGVFFNTLSSNIKTVYELDTLPNDRVRVVFGDGTFAKIPQGTFRFWYRTSNPQPLTINPNAINGKTVTLPYFSNGELYYLTLTYALQEPITNAARTETNTDIRTRANKVYYTQNRMVTGQDYNSFFLRDNAIRKVKTVNRTFSGHSRYAKLHDPTGLYENIKTFATDGRLYEEPTLAVQFVSADTEKLSIDALINTYLKPIIRKSDKSILYFNNYLEKYLSDSTYKWTETSTIGRQARGNITRNGVPVPVGETATNNLRYIGADAFIRYGGVNGKITSVDRVIGDGTTPNGIILDNVIPNGTTLFATFPAFRNHFNTEELLDIEVQLTSKNTFGISWNQNEQKWSIITFNNLAKSTDFALTNQGDTSSTFADASWLLYCEFVPGGNEEDRWRIVDRGLGTFFESAREVDFYYVNSDPVIDPETGSIEIDTITLLEVNEARDSIRRRNIEYNVDTNCAPFIYQFIGDGVTQCFKTSETPLLPNTTVITLDEIYQLHDTDWFLQSSVTGDSICFNIPPAQGSIIQVMISDNLRNAKTNVRHFIADGSTDEYDLGITESIVPNNVLSFLDGVMQNSSLDFGIGDIGDNKSIIYNEILGNGVGCTVHFLSDVDNSLFTKLNFIGNGSTTAFNITTGNLTSDHVLVVLDGIVQHPSNYTVTSTNTLSTLTFDTAPANGVKIRIIAASDVILTRTKMYSFTTDGIKNNFQLTGLNSLDDSNVMVFMDGILQEGNYSTNGVYRITNNSVLFNTAPISGKLLTIFVVVGAVGRLRNVRTPDGSGGGTGGGTGGGSGDNNNTGSISSSSCLVNYLGTDVHWTINDVLRHPDGYINENGVFVLPEDADRSGFSDNPFLFSDIVLRDGFTDLVLWRKVSKFGFSVFDPINLYTSPRGSYGLSSVGDIAEGDTFDDNIINDGDIHFDVTTKKWLIANDETLKWEVAENQNNYKYAVGRDHLKFIWKHYAPDAHRIDPSVSNIMDAYILTTTYNEAYRAWLSNNGAIQDEPMPPSPENLKLQFSDFEEFKIVDDTIIYHSAKFKPLFGHQAIPELQASFKVIQTVGSNLSENDLRLRVYNAINDYFSIDRWNFGETLYFTELAAFIHISLAPDVQTVVIVPKNSNQAFGRLFQVRSEPDELFISAASVDDIEIINSLTDEDLKIGVLSS